MGPAASITAADTAPDLAAGVAADVAADMAAVGRVRAGDPEAFGELAARYQDRVFRLAVRLTGDEHDAEEVVQETMLQAWRKLETFRGEARFSTWLYRVATNTALMHRRARRRHAAEPLDAYLPAFDRHGQHRRLDIDYSVAARVEERVEHADLARAVRAALARLPEANRVAFVLCDLEELPSAEAAAVVGTSAATIRQRAHRARLMLRGLLAHLAGGER